MRASNPSWKMRVMAWCAMIPTALLPLMAGPAEAEQRKQIIKAHAPHLRSELKAGRTDKLTPAQWKAVDAKRANEAAKRKAQRPAVRKLSLKEMQVARGRGYARNRYFAGTMPWQKSLRDVNLANGNLFKSFTDIQVAPGKGAGLALQRTYNSMDDRIGPFGQGWTHAYDIRNEEENPDTDYTDDSLNYNDRADFFAGRHRYHRDADGLYSPPPYLFDELDSNYDKFLVNGPVKALDDTQHGMDGTIKHFTSFAGSLERVCDYIQDRYGNRTNLTYQQVTIGGNTVNLLQTVTDPSGRQLTFHWTDFGANGQPIQRITQVDGPTYSVTYAYNADFNLQSVTLDPGDTAQGHANRTTTFGYTTFTDDQNNVEIGLLASVTDSLGHSLAYSYKSSYGPGGPVYGLATGSLWVSQIVEPAGVDANNQPRTQTWKIEGVDPLNPSITYNSGEVTGVIVYTDNDPGNPSQFVFNRFTNSEHIVYYLFDNQLRTRSTVTNAANGGTLGGTYCDYDSANNVIDTSNEDYVGWGGGTPVLPYLQKSVATYGPHGNVLTQSNLGCPGVSTTTYYNASQYFQKQSVTDVNGRTSTFIVGDNQGNDPTGVLPQSPGNKGSVLYVQDAGYSATNSPSYQKQFAYQYNTFGQKVKETNLNGTVTTYQYGDAWGNLTQVVQDPHVQAGDTHLARTTAMQYDAAGKVLQSTDPKGQTSQFSYTSLGQPTSASFPATANTPAETITYGYGANGRTESVTDNRGTTTLAYENGNDRVKSVTDPVTGTISYTYLPTGERLTMTLPGGDTWTYQYAPVSDPNSHLQPSDDPEKNSRRLTSITDDQGRRVEYSLSPNGVLYKALTNEVFDTSQQTPRMVSFQQSDYTFDKASAFYSSWYSHHWLTQIKHTWNWATLDNYGQTHWNQRLLVQNDYTYDTSGQRNTNTITASDGTNRTEQYGYDELNRLKTVDYGDGQTQGYAFDAMGNRTSKNDSVTGSEGYSFNAANMMTSRTVGGNSSSYTNDADGNTLTGGSRTMTWASQNRMVACVNGANTSSFAYGADGIRKQSTVNGTTTDFILDSSMFVRERNHANGASIATYLVGARGPEYRRDDTTGQVRWYLYDGLGSVLGEVDPNGNITSSRKYDVYGLVRGGNNPAGTSSHKFVGQLGHPSEDNTGLIYMRAPYYDPAVGRFANEDPAGHGRNWFSYCHGNPIAFRDPSGKEDLGEEMEADEGAAEADGQDGQVDAQQLQQYLKSQSAPSKLTGFSQHALRRFGERFAEAFNQKGLDIDRLLESWDPKAAFENHHLNWQMAIELRGILITLVADDAGEVVTMF